MPALLGSLALVQRSAHRFIQDDGQSSLNLRGAFLKSGPEQIRSRTSRTWTGGTGRFDILLPALATEKTGEPAF